MAAAAFAADPIAPYIPQVGASQPDGWSKPDEATATCFCGAVRLAFPVDGPGLIETFVCHCTDCRTITASMFASNFTIADTHLTHVRGRDNLTSFSTSRSIGSGPDTPGHGNTMTNFFCKTCGTLMYRVGSGFPGMSILRLGTVDDFNLHETKLKPKREQFVRSRVSWFTGVEGAAQFDGMGSP